MYGRRQITFDEIKYEGRSINKLQKGVILLIFRLWKFGNIHFVGDLMLNTSYEFYNDDVTVTSFINIRYGIFAVEIIPQGTAFCYSFAVACGQKDLAQIIPLTTGLPL